MLCLYIKYVICWVDAVVGRQKAFRMGIINFGGRFFIFNDVEIGGDDDVCIYEA